VSAYLDVIIAGFGGQGVMLAGNLLAHAGMDLGLNVTFIPIYGPEMRGGTANCTVVISEEEIGSPIIRRPKSAIILNQPSLDKFQPRIEDGGTQIVNSSLADVSLVENERLRSLCIPADEIAEKLRSRRRLTNMVALGAFIRATGIVPLEKAVAVLSKTISGHYTGLIPQNAEALKAGYNYTP
jgi:2-oxoglutarate ferredoxin oxidoreductase subunit gamma